MKTRLESKSGKVVRKLILLPALPKFGEGSNLPPSPIFCKGIRNALMSAGQLQTLASRACVSPVLHFNLSLQPLFAIDFFYFLLYLFFFHDDGLVF